jgi:hypothetical protein
MSTTVKPTTLTEATKLVGERLGLTNAKHLGAALAAVVVEEIEQNPSFEERVRVAYTASETIKATAAKKDSNARMPKTALVDLVPIKHVEGFEFNPAAPMDPYLLHEAFGTNQLRIILEALPVAKLKESAAKVERRNPGTKPANRTQKTALIAYIIKYVVG